MKNNQNLENLVQQTKNGFQTYFAAVNGKNFKQFYYDWHIDNMLAPFAGIVTYFHENYGAEGAQKFHEFTQDMLSRIKIYNADKPQLSVLKNADFAKDNNGKLSSLIDGLETFGFEFRQFMYNFADKKDHDEAFCGWPLKTNMPYSMQYGMMMVGDVLRFLDKNFLAATQGKDVYVRALFAADNFLRQKMAKAYQYNNGYNFHSRRKMMQAFASLRDDLANAYGQKTSLSAEMANLFQTENGQSTQTSNYWPSGFELEFYVPEEYKDYGKLINYLKEKNGWKNIYSSNKDASVYQDENSAGVIMRDESLVRYNNLAAVEYASKVMKNKEDEETCLKILDVFDQGHVNAHCSLHQHLAADHLDLLAYKRLVKRMMQHEEEIVAAFAAPERRDNKLLYATYIGRNLSEDNKRDYPFLCVMAEMCDTKEQLQDFASFGHKYKTLNIMPKHTVEMRFMNANFNKKFVKAFLQFNREFVAAAAQNMPSHVNRFLLNKYSWYNNQKSDSKTVMHQLPYFYQYAYDSFQPQQHQVSKDVIEQEQKCWRLIMHALNETGKVAYVNAAFNKKVKEAKAYGR